MGKFRQIFTELSAQDTPIFSFTVDNYSKEQGILTKLAIYVLTVRRSGLELLMGAFLQILSALDTSIFSFLDDNLSK